MEAGNEFDSSSLSLSNDINLSNAPLASDSLGVSHLIRAFQVNGHSAAKLDPLGVHWKESFPSRPENSPEFRGEFSDDGYPDFLHHTYHGFTDADLDRKLNFLGTSTGGQKGYLEELAVMNQTSKVTLRQIINELRKTYCGTLAVEYMHIGDTHRCNWLRERVENPKWLHYDTERKMHILERLCFAGKSQS